MASNEQKPIPLDSYQNWEEHYNQGNNRNKRILKCRCQGIEKDNGDSNTQYKVTNNLSEKIESLDRKKDIVSKQYADYLRNQEIERIKKLKELQAHTIPHFDCKRNEQSKISEQLVTSSAQANLYEQFERNMRNLNGMSIGNQGGGNGQRQGIDPSLTTSITDKGVYDKHHNKDYEDYIEKHKEYSDYNLLLSKNKKQSNERQFEIDKLHEGNVIIKKNFFNDYDQKMRSYENDRKLQYKQSLDQQRMFQMRSKLARERYTIESAMKNPQYFQYNSPEYIDRTFLNYNQFVEVNPCKFMLC